MAKTVKTRIKNRFDSLANWNSTGVELLQGEIAIVKVGLKQIDTETGDVVNVPAFLMKVGENYSADEATAAGDNTLRDTPKPFGKLPWMSATAADVYNWAKVEDPSTITVKYNKGSTESPDWVSATLANVLKATVQNAADIDSLTSDKLSDITVTPIDQTDTGVVKTVTKGKKGEVTVSRGLVVTEEIDNKAITTGKLGDAAVTAGKIEDGAVTNTKVASGIAASKIDYSTGKKTVEATLTDLYDKVNAFKGGLSVDPTTATEKGVVQGITYDSTLGKFSVTYNEVTTNDIKDKAVTDAKIDTVSAAKVIYTAGDTAETTITLPEKIGDIEDQIAGINTAIAGGVHFIGEVTSPTDLTASSTTRTVTINSKSYSANNGDIVIQNSKEYIWVAATETTGTWKELGDLSRVGAVESLLADLDETQRTDNKYVTHIALENNKLVTKKARPTATEVSYGNSTVNAALADHDNKLTGLSESTVQAAIDEAKKAVTDIIDNLDLIADPTSGGEATSTENFVTQVRQTNGQVSYARKTLPVSSTSKSGIVKLNDTVVSTSTTEAATANAVKKAYDKANHSHTAYENQNAFSKIAVDKQDTIEADDPTDTITFVGSNVSITTNAAADTVTFTVANGTTSTKGIVQLDNVISTSTTTAATPNIVKTANDRAKDAQDRVGAIEANYLKTDDNDNLVQSNNGTLSEIIFDCGGAN